MGVSLHNPGFGSGISDMTPRAQATEEKTDKTGLHKNVNISGHSRTQSTE